MIENGARLAAEAVEGDVVEDDRPSRPRRRRPPRLEVVAPSGEASEMTVARVEGVLAKHGFREKG